MGESLERKSIRIDFFQSLLPVFTSHKHTHRPWTRVVCTVLYSRTIQFLFDTVTQQTYADSDKSTKYRQCLWSQLCTASAGLLAAFHLLSARNSLFGSVVWRDGVILPINRWCVQFPAIQLSYNNSGKLFKGCACHQALISPDTSCTHYISC